MCARCLGLYLGAVGGVLLWMGASGLGGTPHAVAARLAHPTVVRRILIATALPTIVTVAASWLGWDAGNVIRWALALPLGATLAAVVAAFAAGDLR